MSNTYTYYLHGVHHTKMNSYRQKTEVTSRKPYLFRVVIHMYLHIQLKYIYFIIEYF